MPRLFPVPEAGLRRKILRRELREPENWEGTKQPFEFFIECIKCIMHCLMGALPSWLLRCLDYTELVWAKLHQPAQLFAVEEVNVQ